MYLSLILFIVGFVLLIKGADILVDGASSIAKKFGVSALFIGLTIVAFGTSAPELIVSVLASLKGSSDIALGNIIGSNIANSLLILGISAIIAPIFIKGSTITKEIPFSFLAVLAVSIMVNDYFLDGTIANSLGRIDGLILILFFCIFIFYTFGINREKEGMIEKIENEFEKKSKEYKTYVSVTMILAGLAGLALGGKWIVDGALVIAEIFGFSESLVGLTIVAVGTSLPELATSAMAALKGEKDIAIGNVVGSNIFNFLWVLGLSAIIAPISFNLALNVDLAILLFITIILYFLIFTGKKWVLTRREGIILVGIYILYIIYLFYRG